VQLTDYADKIVITHVFPKPGKIGMVTDMIKNLKKVWESSHESIAVYRAVASGEPAFIIVTRLKQGLKELGEDYLKPLSERYNAVNGAGSFDAYQKDYADAVANRWSELLTYSPRLSSK
jgi:hypothetical protein